MRRSVGNTILSFSACLMIFAVMFAHVTAVVYVDTGLIAVGLVVLWLGYRKASLPITLPPRSLLWAFGLWATWAALSLLWSIDPGMSARGWLDEILYPLVIFLGLYHLGSRQSDGTLSNSPLEQPVSAASMMPRRVIRAQWLELSCLTASLLLAILSVTGFQFLPVGMPKDGALHFYPGVGAASTVALFVMPIFIMLSTRRATIGIGLLGVFCALTIGIATLNRFFYLSAACVLAIGYWPLLKRHWAIAVSAAGVLAVCASLMIVHSSSERGISETGPQSAQTTSVKARLADIMSRDTRPLIWRFYLTEAKKHPLLGIGFGKRLPKRAYSDQMPAWILKIEPQATTHAHNLFLNTFLQVGMIGLLLQIFLLAMMLRAIFSTARDPWLRSACVAVVVGMVSKNLTDDFMWQSTMLAFWAHFAYLLGRARVTNNGPIATGRNGLTSVSP